MANEQIGMSDSTLIGIFKKYTDNAVDNVKEGISFVDSVEDLPSVGDPKTIYYVSTSTSAQDGIYDIYVWNKDASVYVYRGTTEINLDDYTTDEELDERLAPIEGLADNFTIEDGKLCFVTGQESSDGNKITNYDDLNPIMIEKSGYGVAENGQFIGLLNIQASGTSVFCTLSTFGIKFLVRAFVNSNDVDLTTDDVSFLEITSPSQKVAVHNNTDATINLETYTLNANNLWDERSLSATVSANSNYNLNSYEIDGDSFVNSLVVEPNAPLALDSTLRDLVDAVEQIANNVDSAVETTVRDVIASDVPVILSETLPDIVEDELSGIVAQQLPAEVSAQIATPTTQAVNTYCAANFSEWSGALDSTLTNSSMAAPADKVGEIKSALTHNESVADRNSKLLGVNGNVSCKIQKTVGRLVGYVVGTYYPDIRTGASYDDTKVLSVDLSDLTCESLIITKPSSPLSGVVVLYTDLSTKATAVSPNDFFNASGFSNNYVKVVATDSFFTIDVRRLKNDGYTDLYLGANLADDIDWESVYDGGITDALPIIKDTINGKNIASLFTTISGLIVGYTENYQLAVRTGGAYLSTKVSSITLSSLSVDKIAIIKPSSPLSGVAILYTDLSTKASSIPLSYLNRTQGYTDNYIKAVGNETFYVVDIAKLKADSYTTLAFGSNANDDIYVSDAEENHGYNIDVLKEKESLRYNTPLVNLSIFGSVGAIGDSYTKTLVIKSNNTGVELPNQGWLANMCAQSNTDYHIYAVSGATTKSILTETNGLVKALSDPARDCYFYALGINDTDSLGHEYLGSIADITNDYTQNPDTFYGNYARIIEQLMNHAPNAKHVMFKIPLSMSRYAEFSAAIAEIASHYNIPCINPFDDRFYSSDLYEKVLGHPTIVGYSGMGIANLRLFSKCVEENFTYFKFSTVG